jgi:hypothetical protein
MQRSTKKPKGVLHIKDAILLLESGQPVDLRLWKLATGDILEYKGAVCIGGHWRRGTHRVRLPRSGVIREFRDVTLFEINNNSIYL